MSVMSMTGFGSASFDVDGQVYRVDIKAVNHRNLNLRMKLSQEFAHIEPKANKVAKASLMRGAVDVMVNRDGACTRELDITVDRAGLGAMLSVLKEVASDVGAAVPTMDAALKYGDFIDVRRASADPEKLERGLLGALQKALDGLRVMREREGAALLEDIQMRLQRLDGCLDEVEAIAPQVYEGYLARMQKRMADAEERTGLELDPARLASELVVWSDKSDVTEELVRARAHLVHFRELLAEAKDESGKKLDFLAQELFREFNTIGSKCRDAGMAGQVVDAKVELEKIREQVQNIA